MNTHPWSFDQTLATWEKQELQGPYGWPEFMAANGFGSINKPDWSSWRASQWKPLQLQSRSWEIVDLDDKEHSQLDLHHIFPNSLTRWEDYQHGRQPFSDILQRIKAHSYKHIYEILEAFTNPQCTLTTSYIMLVHGSTRLIIDGHHRMAALALYQHALQGTPIENVVLKDVLQEDKDVHEGRLSILYEKIAEHHRPWMPAAQIQQTIYIAEEADTFQTIFAPSSKLQKKVTLSKLQHCNQVWLAKKGFHMMIQRLLGKTVDKITSKNRD